MHLSKLEDEIRDAGSEIFTHIKDNVPSLFNANRWKGRVLDWSMQDEWFKIHLFRFVDVLPSLKDDKLVLNYFVEYFKDKNHDLPEVLKIGIKGIGISNILKKLTGTLVKSNVESLAHHFIASSSIDKSVSVVSKLRNEGFTYSIDLLGELVLSDLESDQYTKNYCYLLDTLNKNISNFNSLTILDSDNIINLPKTDISFKISAFFSQFDPLNWVGTIEGIKKGIMPVLIKAKELNAHVTFDMEHSYFKDITIAAFMEILSDNTFKEYSNFGIALQAYLADSKDDLLKLISYAKDNNKRIAVRLVKGAYWDFETIVNRQKGWEVPVFLTKEESDANYEELSKILIENIEYVRPAFATHNIRSIAHAISYTKLSGLNKNAIEFQTLFGMAEPINEALKEMGYRVRVYTPVGELLPGMAYLVRRLLENTSNESFLRKSFVENESFDDLIKKPLNKDEPYENVISHVFENEPLTNFSIKKNRDSLKRSIEECPIQFEKKYPLIISGKDVYKEDYTKSVNPSNPDEVVGIVSNASKEDIEDAVKSAKETFVTWSSKPVFKRAQILKNAADILREKKYEFAALMVFEAGKNWVEADGDVCEAIDFLEFYASEAINIVQYKRVGDYPGEKNENTYYPRGVGVVISPWNFPLAIACGMVSASIVCGNTVLFKPSSNTPVTGYKLYKLFKDAGLPDGVIQFVPGKGSEIGDFMVSNTNISFIAFTGSMEVGLRINRLAAQTGIGQRHIKKVVAELGGKNAIIIDESADLDEAVKGVLLSFLSYQGQKCSACSRAIVVGDIYDEFIERLKNAVLSIKVGDAKDAKNYMGPMIDEAAMKKVKKYIKIGRETGKEVLSVDINRKGYFVGPSVFADIDPMSKLAQDEIFGPVLAIIKATDIDNAINIANGTPYALTGGAYSRSPKNIEKVKLNFDVGNLYINRKITGAIVGRQPFGGAAMSGTGQKAGGHDYLKNFLISKSISENTMRKGFSGEIETV